MMLWLVNKYTKVKTLMLRLNQEYGHACEPMTKCNGHGDVRMVHDMMPCMQMKLRKIYERRVNFRVLQLPLFYHLKPEGVNCVSFSGVRGRRGLHT